MPVPAVLHPSLPTDRSYVMIDKKAMNNERKENGNGLLSAEEAAVRLNVSKRTLLKWARKGKIGCIRLCAKMIRFSEDQLAEFIRRMTHEMQPEIATPPVAMLSSKPSTRIQREAQRKQGDTASWKELRKEMDSWGNEKK